MKLLKTILWSSVFASAVAFTAMPHSAFAGDKAETPKCDAKGKPCKSGKDCKPENCKKEETKESK